MLLFYRKENRYYEKLNLLKLTKLVNSTAEIWTSVILALTSFLLITKPKLTSKQWFLAFVSSTKDPGLDVRGTCGISNNTNEWPWTQDGPALGYANNQEGYFLMPFLSKLFLRIISWKDKITLLLPLSTTQWMLPGKNIRFCHEWLVHKFLRKGMICLM